MGTDKAVIPDDGSVENYCSHADQALIPDGAGMDDGPVADGHSTSNGGPKVGRHMDDGVVLNVAFFTDDDGGYIPAERGCRPDTGPWPDAYGACNKRAWRDKGAWGNNRLASEVLPHKGCEITGVIGVGELGCGMSIHEGFLTIMQNGC